MKREPLAPGYTEVRCDNCHGHGEVMHRFGRSRHPCRQCHGAGYFEVYVGTLPELPAGAPDEDALRHTEENR